jgi:UDP-N-acetylmuramate--alanine ligase
VSEWAGRRLHFIGIGGAGMSGLALVARSLGASVTGSDRASSSYVERVLAAGIEVSIGHAAGAVPAGAEVVVSTAISAANPELAAAVDAGSVVLHRGDLLGEVSRLKPCVAVAGTHGKTTTASMAAHVLVSAGMDPSYLIGGELRSTGTNAFWGSGEWLVVEADESDRSFFKLAPDLAVITNVELDHHATYRSTFEIEEAFASFASLAERTAAWVEAGVRGADSTFGIGAGDLAARDVVLGEGGSRFVVDGVSCSLSVPGEHNVLNALAALEACRAAGVSVADAAAGLASFSGARRRFEPRGRTAGGALVYDDYAHHPTEVRATLEAARTLGQARVVACFQPHLFSRTAMLARAFGEALALADVVCVLDVYPARELASDWPGVSGWLVAAAAASAAHGRRVYWTPSMDDAFRLLSGLLGEGDLLLTLGAGDVDSLAGRMVEPADDEVGGPREP